MCGDAGIPDWERREMARAKEGEPTAGKASDADKGGRQSASLPVYDIDSPGPAPKAADRYCTEQEAIRIASRTMFDRPSGGRR